MGMKNRRRVDTLICLWLLTLVATTIAYAQPQLSKIDAALQAALQSQEPRRLRVIVRIQPGRVGFERQALKGNGFAIRAEHKLINAISLEVPASALSGLAKNPNVLSISIDATMTPTGAPSQATNASVLRETLGLSSNSPRGSGAGVVVLDSGIYPSPDFEGRISAFYDFTRGGIAVPPYEDYSNGTNVASLIGGTGCLPKCTTRGI